VSEARFLAAICVDVAATLVFLAIGAAQIHWPDAHRVMSDEVFSAIVWGAPMLSRLGGGRPGWPSRSWWWALPSRRLPPGYRGTFNGFAALCVALYTMGHEELELDTTVAASGLAPAGVHLHLLPRPHVIQFESIQTTFAVILFMPILGPHGARRSARAGLEAELADQEHKKAEAACVCSGDKRACITRDRHYVIAPAMSVTIIQAMAARGWGRRCPRRYIGL